MRSKTVKPKRPARKRNVLVEVTGEYVGELLTSLNSSEADKRILLDENLTLQSALEDLRLEIAEVRKIETDKTILMRDLGLVRAERDALAKRNQELEAQVKGFSLAAMRQQTESSSFMQRMAQGIQAFQWAKDKSRRKLPPIETKCQMEVEKW